MALIRCAGGSSAGSYTFGPGVTLSYSASLTEQSVAVANNVAGYALGFESNFYTTQYANSKLNVYVDDTLHESLDSAEVRAANFGIGEILGGSHKVEIKVINTAQSGSTLSGVLIPIA